MLYFIKTFGCQMNHSDSERIATFLEGRNFSMAKSITDADLVIFNTCGIRKAAEDRVYGAVHNLRKTNSKVKIVFTGCMAHRKDVQKVMENKVDLFTEIKNFPEKFGIMNQELKIKNENSTKKTDCDSSLIIHDSTPLDKEAISYLSIQPKHASPFQANVPIMTGCNNFCAYCVVPYARGREVSRPADEILSEIKELVDKGYKSITLLGQNVNSYASQVHKVSKVRKVHKEKIESIDFAKLLKMINKIPGKFWLSFVSSHPKDMDDELIETVAKCKKVCEWVHLPVQAGDDEILRRMNRKYTQTHYLGRVSKIKAAFKKYKPQALFAISSDIIVGFPGETKKQFLGSAAVMEKAKFDMVYFGQFSPRPGTAAWNMKDNVSIKEKERRETFLNEILKKTAFANNRKYVGKTVEVLIEKEKGGPVKSGLPDHGVKIYLGKTRTQKNVRFISKKNNLVGTFAKVKIEKANTWNLEGILN